MSKIINATKIIEEIKKIMGTKGFVSEKELELLLKEMED